MYDVCGSVREDLPEEALEKIAEFIESKEQLSASDSFVLSAADPQVGFR